MELYLFLLLRQFDKNIACNKGQSNPLITIPSCSPNSMNISSRGKFFTIFWLIIIDNQGDCTNINTSTDCLCAEEDLDLFVSKLCYSCCLWCWAILGMDVVFSHLTDISTLTMNIVNIQIIFTHIRSSRIIYQKSVFLTFKKLVKFT